MQQATTYEYDPQGRLQKILDAKNQTTDYGYDSQGRIETISYDDGRSVTLSYDANGNLAGYNDGVTSASYTYDAVGRKLSETVNYGAFSKSFSYTYYANGLKKSFTAPDGTMYEYVYGSNNELREVRIPGLGSITISEYQWNRPKTMLYPGGSTREYEYDALMRLKHLTVKDPGGNILLDYAYEYDSRGNIVSKVTEHGTYSYGYDGTSRLTSADNPTLDDESYSYDAVGNRTSASNANGSITHNANNELTVYGEVEYAYDVNGSMIQKKLGNVAVNYVYNADNRLVKVEDDLTKVVIAEYYYDPFGRRLWKEVAGTRTYFFYSDEGLIGEYDASGTELRNYGYKPDSTWTTDPLFLKQTGQYYFYQNDHLGTPQKLTAVNGEVVWSAQYTAFGEATVDFDIVTNNLRFSGQYFDAETGLHYNWYRYYDVIIGRYARKDPIGFTGGDVNIYRYAGDNPSNAIDPYGLFEGSEIGDRIFYSCNCGWIDTIHLRDARDRLWRIDVWPGIIEHDEGNGEDTLIDLYLEQPCQFTYFTGQVRLLYPPGTKLEEEKIRLKLAFTILSQFEEAFESHQSRFWAGMVSGFAVEDLPSDHLGFMEAAGLLPATVPQKDWKNWNEDGSTEEWEQLCQPLNKEDSLKIYQFGLFLRRFPLTNETIRPKLWDDAIFRKFFKDAGSCHPCEGKDTSIPDLFKTNEWWKADRWMSGYKWLSIEEHFGYAEWDSGFYSCAYDKWGKPLLNKVLP